MIQKSFGYACKKIRESKGLSQEKFALLIEMDRTYYACLMVLAMFMVKSLLQKTGSPYSGKVFEFLLYIFTFER